MNFLFISPHFPHTYWQFCDRLNKNGINVLGIGDAPYESLEEPLKAALTEYYRVGSLEDYDQVYRAAAFNLLQSFLFFIFILYLCVERK